MTKTDKTALAPEVIAEGFERQRKTYLLDMIRFELSELTDSESEGLLQWMRKEIQSTRP